MKILPLLAGLCLLLPLLASAAPYELRDREGRLTTLHFDAEEAALLTAGSAEETGRLFLAEYAPALGLQDPVSQLRALPTEVDELGQTHLRWQQVWQGVPVRTGEVALHLDKQGRPQLASAKVVPGVTCATIPTILPEEAKLLAEDAWLMEYGPVAIPEIMEPELWITDGHSLENYEGDPRLTWWVSTGTTIGHKSGDNWIIDAFAGETLGRKTSERQLDRRIYDCSNSGGWACPSEQWNETYQYWFGRREGRPPRGPNPTTAFGYGGSLDTDNLYDLFAEVDEYWLSNLNRNGANQLGGAGDGYWCPSPRICGYVLCDHLWTTACPDNATYYPQTGELDFCEGTASTRDVVGHEYFHAVIWFEFDPHGTEYSYEIGALEEGSCDVFGEMLELHSTDETDWTMDIAGDPLRWRFLSNPSQGINGSWGPYPSHFSSPYYRCSSEDNGGIHHNSTITSHAAYLMAEGGLFNGCEIPAIGIDAVQRIWYRAWCQYFTRTTTFNEAVIAFQIACQDLYGETHPEYLSSVTAALQAAEMDQPGYCSGIPEVAPLCAERGAGAAWTGLAAGEPDSVFSSAETVWLHSADGVADRRLLVHRLPAGSVPDVWEEILSGADTLSVTVAADGSLAAALGPQPAGEWTLLLDGDRDGFYQPWSDLLLPLSITPAVQVTGLTVHTESSERLNFSWTPLTNAPQGTVYRVEAAVSPAFSLPLTLATTADTTWTDSLSVPAMPLRLYRVKAVMP